MIMSVTELLRQLFQRRPKSAQVAAERLKIILAHERRGVSAPLMEQMKGELRLASTMTRNACVVLQFRLTDVEDAK